MKCKELPLRPCITLNPNLERDQEGGHLQRPSSLLKDENLFSGRGFVNMSAIYFSVSIKWSSKDFFATSSLKK